MKKYKQRLAVLAGSVAMICLAGCGSVQPVALSTDTVQGAQATAKEAGTHVFSGKMVGIEEVTIFPKTAGRVKAVLHDTGDRVEAGAPLVEMETVELAASLSMAKAELAMAQAKWEEAKKGPRAEDLQYAKAGWQQAASKYEEVKNGKRPEELSQLAASEQSAKSVYESAKAKYARAKALYEQGGLSSQGLDDAQTALAQAEAQYVRAEEEVRLAKQGVTKPALQSLASNVDQMKAMYDKTKNGATKEQIAQYEASVQKAQAAVANAQYQLDNATLKSPISGYISTKNVQAGEMANANTAVMSVVNTDRLYVVIGVSETDIARFSPEQQVDVAIEAIGQHVQGKVARISPKADPGTNMYTVKIVVSNAKGNLRSGMTGAVSL
ncbi:MULTISPECIES: HlyD family secretion protein [Brevibacillus]|uniref:HlyD family secretion protein n=1 Tax=Brevibacillus TaxID=55080 RepID=UPI000EE95A4F|nr:efflux RND transporter periplasmic adaptor subunit [Brevibacillus sp.]HBZ79154.1 efflux RND transporter periplasmic adaptor subunit [Brevibacillus sp.]